MSQKRLADTQGDNLARARSIGFLIYPDVEPLDVCGPLDVFSFVDRWWRATSKVDHPMYQLEVIAACPGPVSTSSGLQIVANRAYQEIDGGLDTLIVAGGEGAERACSDRALVDWLRGIATRVRRIASVCNGAFLLAASGLLDGRRATTHWAFSEHLARAYPSIRVEPDLIFIRDGQVYTSGGITAGMDLALAMLEEDHGSDAARYVAQGMLLFLRRPGGQSQFSTYLRSEASNRRDIRELQAWILSHPDDDLSIEALAERVAMSPRNFARIFLAETGMTPAKFVERARVEATRCKLEQSSTRIEAIAEHCGFGTAECMRRSFRRVLGVGPEEIRARFKSTGIELIRRRSLSSSERAG